MRVAYLLLVCGALACAEDPTGVDLRLVYDDTLPLAKLQLVALDKDATIAPEHRVRIDVPASWVDTEVTLRAYGLNAAGARLVGGEVTFVAQADQLIPVEVTLAPLVCGAWCTPGATRCVGNGVATCVIEAGCTVWRAPEACPAATPHCSLGTCMQSCIEECVAGETRCASDGAVETCGQGDDDACRDWVAGETCAAGSACSNGACRTSCSNACARGQTRCAGGGVETCGDANLDGCTDWGPAVACATGICQAGACATQCSDDCTAASCDGTRFEACGQFDGDSCRDMRGTPCDVVDGCLVGTCTVSGCKTEPRVCATPDAPICVSTSTLRTYAPSGTCSGGACAYAPTDRTCEFGCQAGACRTTRCDATCESATQVAMQLADGAHAVADGKHVYYADGFGTIYRKAIAGGSVGPRSEFATHSGRILHMVMNGDQVMWLTSEGWLQRQAVTATTSDWLAASRAHTFTIFSINAGIYLYATDKELFLNSRPIVSGRASIGGVATVGSTVYWTDRNTGSLWYKIMPNGELTRVVDGLVQPQALHVDATHAYVATDRGVVVVTLATRAVETYPGPTPWRMVADNETVCWNLTATAFPEVQCMAKRTRAITKVGDGGAYAVALDGDSVYLVGSQLVAKSRCGCGI